MLYVSAGSLYLFPYNHIEVIDKVEGSVFSDRDPLVISSTDFVSCNCVLNTSYYSIRKAIWNHLNFTNFI